MRSGFGIPSSRRRRRSLAIRSASASPAECGTHGPPYSVLSRWQCASTSPGSTSRPATSTTSAPGASTPGPISAIAPVADEHVGRLVASPRPATAQQHVGHGAATLPRSDAVSVFRDAERQYLAGGRQLGRIATVGADGTPHVVPVAWIYNAARDTIDVGGAELERTKKFRDIARTGRAAIVIDDLASTDPWHPRGIEVRGRGEAIAMPTPLIRIHPERIVSWGIETGRSARSV